MTTFYFYLHGSILCGLKNNFLSLLFKIRQRLNVITMITKFIVILTLFCGAFGKPLLTSTYVIKNGEMTKVEQETDTSEIEKPLLSLDDIPVKTTTYNTTDEGLFQGECNPDKRHPLIYRENFVLESDNKSQVTAAMEVRVDDKYDLTCVEIFNRNNHTDVLKILRGGIHHSYVEVGVSPGYGKGFDFSVQLYGYIINTID